nr:MAG TPA: putative ATP-dependent RNA helicase [Caudoviricetes sp.]
MVINVVDAGCGIGKTTSVINMINEDTRGNRYLYITPYLSEVSRIMKECPRHRFREPKNDESETKLENIKKLLDKGENIVSTHALFKKMDEEILDIIEEKEYILIMDEVANVVEPLKITNDDIKIISTKYTKIKEDGLVEWTLPTYEGKFEEYKRMIEFNSVMASKDKNGNVNSYVWIFPIRVFEGFKKVYILTYMFEGQIQKYYYDLYNVEYKQWYVKDFHLTLEKQKYDMEEFKSKIKICDIPNLNKIGDPQFSLSKKWFKTYRNKENVKKLKKNVYSFFRNNAKSKAKENLWTTFKFAKDDLKGKGYSSGFAPMNIRATNDLRHKKAVAYLVNRYLDPIVKVFFFSKNIKVDESAFALSELIQFLFRTCVRDKEDIYIYIPSKRMRNLLEKWLKEKDH